MTTATRSITTAATAEEKKLRQLIHVARRELQMDDATYRTMLRAAGGADSTSIMRAPQLRKVLDQAKRAGFQVRAKRPDGRPDRAQDTRLEARKVRALWLFLHALGAVKNSSETALAAYVKRIAYVEDMSWARGDAMTRLIETLKSWAMRGCLPDAVKQLRAQILQLTDAGLLPPDQHEACEKAHRLVTLGNPTFNRYWEAWEIYASVVGRQLPDDVRGALRSVG